MNKIEYNSLQKKLARMKGTCSNISNIEYKLKEYQHEQDQKVISKKRLEYLKKLVDDVSAQLGLKLKLSLKTESYGSFIGLEIYTNNLGWQNFGSYFQRKTGKLSSFLVKIKRKQLGRKPRNIESFDYLYNIREEFVRHTDKITGTLTEKLE